MIFVSITVSPIYYETIVETLITFYMTKLLLTSLAQLKERSAQNLQLFPQSILLLCDLTHQVIWLTQGADSPTIDVQNLLDQLKSESPLSPVIQLQDKQQHVMQLLHYRQQVQLIQEKQEGWLYLILPYTPPAKQTVSTTSSVQVSEQFAQRFHSSSPKMQQMFSIIQRVAVTEFPVLVRGESGSGKELVAKAIHDFSLRKDRVFIAINCAALNVNILESELFGHVKGAFTGAIRDHKGVFEQAAGGTLFLDEIAEIPLELQAKLLRVLETGEFTPLGGEKPIRANVRIIAATHRALREEARQGRFRQDLLYRLRVIPIFIPPLRERKEDLPLLTQFILSENTAAERTNPIRISEAAMQSLMAYDWPGNVRELRNTLLYALIMAHDKEQIDLEDLPQEIMENVPLQNPNVTNTPVITAEKLRLVLAKYHNDQQQAADELGISRTTLWRYRKKYHL